MKAARLLLCFWFVVVLCLHTGAKTVEEVDELIDLDIDDEATSDTNNPPETQDQAAPAEDVSSDENLPNPKDESDTGHADEDEPNAPPGADEENKVDTDLEDEAAAPTKAADESDAAPTPEENKAETDMEGEALPSADEEDKVDTELEDEAVAPTKAAEEPDAAIAADGEDNTEVGVKDESEAASDEEEKAETGLENEAVAPTKAAEEQDAAQTDAAVPVDVQPEPKSDPAQVEASPVDLWATEKDHAEAPPSDANPETKPPAAAAVAESISLEVEGVGTLTVGPDQEPADLVEAFAQQALDAGLGISNDMMVQMLTQLCNRRACSRLQLRAPTPKASAEVAEPLTVKVDGVGSLTVAPEQEPAAMVEAFAQQALDAGLGISNDIMVQMLTQLCNRRACGRLELRAPTPKAAAGVTEPLTVQVDGVGSLTVNAEQEPADMVEAFAQQALDAGLGISNDMMVQMLTQLCNRRACGRLELRAPTPKAAAEDVGLLRSPTPEAAVAEEAITLQ